jgi:peptide/nickel transport system substrate-binding protein
VIKGGLYAYGSYPELDELFAEQAGEIDRAKRTALLDRMQQIVHEKSIYAPIWQLAFISGVGPRVGHSSFGSIKGFVYPAPYEDLTLLTA